MNQQGMREHVGKLEGPVFEPRPIWLPARLQDWGELKAWNATVYATVINVKAPEDEGWLGNH